MRSLDNLRETLIQACEMYSSVLDEKHSRQQSLRASAAAREKLSECLLMIEALNSPAPSGWQPIATAPKDGTRVMLWNGEDEPVFAHFETSKEWGKESSPVNEWVSEWQTVGGYDAGWDRVHGATHWQPLPDAPGEDCDCDDGWHHGQGESIACEKCTGKAGEMTL